MAAGFIFQILKHIKMDLNTRPHILKWEGPGTPGGQDEDGFPTEGTPGAIFELPCRFHQESNKVFKNQDSTETMQVGKIRLDADVELPSVGTYIQVIENKPSGQIEHFSGHVKELYRGQMSSRLEV